MEKKKYLKKYFGYSTFKDGQGEVIDSIITGCDVLGVFNTGFGKSICFQLPSLMKGGMSIVISPLIALMKDQIEGLAKKGILSATINSTIDKRQMMSILQDCTKGIYKFLYIAPERLKSKSLLYYLKQCEVNQIVVDEAHCLTEWGFDFRRSYMNIKGFRNEHFPNAQIIAMTATANEEAEKVIIEKLGFKEGYEVHRRSADRTNLSVFVKKVKTKVSFIRDYICEKGNVTGIIYVRTHAKAKGIADALNKDERIKHLGIKVEHYHGGMQGKERNVRQGRWMNGTSKVMVCTHAFGMGVDKADVRYIFHVDIPEGLEAYAQEIGRGGRDGEKSDCYFLYTQSELEKFQEHAKLFPSNKFIEDVFFYLQARTREEVLSFTMGKLASELNCKRNLLRNAINLLSNQGLINCFSEQGALTDIYFLKTQNELRQYRVNNPAYATFIFQLSRMSRGKEKLSTSIKTVARRTSNDIAGCKQVLEHLSNEGLLNWKEKEELYIASVPTVFESREKFSIDSMFVKGRKDSHDTKFNGMYGYISNTEICRNKIILSYFGEHSEDCGRCDICLNQK